MNYAIFVFQALTNNECSNHSFGSLGSSSDKESEVCSVTFLISSHRLLLKFVKQAVTVPRLLPQIPQLLKFASDGQYIYSVNCYCRLLWVRMDLYSGA